MGLFVRRFSGVVGAVLFSGAAFAQVANPTAGQVQETLKKAPVLRAPDESVIQKPRQSRPSAPSEGKKITVNTFTFAASNFTTVGCSSPSSNFTLSCTCIISA